MTDVYSNVDVLSLPKGSKYLDPEVAGEGQGVAEDGQTIIMSNGETVNWSPPPARPVVPDWSQIKPIRHYFNRSGYQVYPAWLYHPTEQPRLVKDAKEAKALGCYYRQATFEERGRFGIASVWDWTEGCQWRPKPWDGTIKFDPKNPGNGKTYISGEPNPVNAQHQLIKDLVPMVAATVVQALRSEGGPQAPSNVDAKDWQQFLEFKAWQESQKAVHAVADAAEPSEQDGNALNVPTEDRDVLVAEAESKGIKVDKRWGIDRLKIEIAKAA